MGRPIELGTPRVAAETESSSDEEGWVAEGSDDDNEEGEWQDPTGGALTAVFEAAEAGDVDELQEALGRLDVSIDTRGEDSDTAIHLAALYGHSECVRVLLAAGARADVADADGALPLHDAAAGGYVDICTMLLDAVGPSTIDRGDSEGDTPLHNAARGGHDAVVQLLLERGADATLQNDEFKTPGQLAERGTPARQLLEEAQRQAEAAAAAAQPEVPPPAAEVA
ncbi:ankyrin domain isoform A [Chlorella sorokiniana]|uniref:Ankyrin domain isoform A n=1 Tax=Chlorella sorokiniana TaxID=3076 RepID=A0A2P6TQC5_CHLSO|nr:ankyrin domain isoform B [Chlorella sorokiniana]PRW56242.1 ankyrin domain isoform A [Chlorella sorokiniana]|eukprot:PRW56241.1 ankyrin domain isoform B [Chlorella sorokiniana]